MEKSEPFVGQPQFLMIVLVIVVGLGHTVIDATQHAVVAFLTLDEFGIILQSLNGQIRLFHVQIDDANLLVGHCTPQFVVAFLRIVEHLLGLL